MSIRHPGRHEDVPSDEHQKGTRHQPPPAPPADPHAGIAREVGDLDDPERDDDALPGHAGGGLAGG